MSPRKRKPNPERQFRQELIGQFPLDPIFEEYVRAWMAYHEAADQVDGHLPYYDRVLGPIAVRAGFAAMKEVLPHSLSLLNQCPEWQRAKLEALRRLGK